MSGTSIRSGVQKPGRHITGQLNFVGVA